MPAPVARPVHRALTAIAPTNRRDSRKASNLMLKARPPTMDLGRIEMARAVHAGMYRPERTNRQQAGWFLGRFAIRPANSYLSAISMELRYGCLDAVDRTC